MSGDAWSGRKCGSLEADGYELRYQREPGYKAGRAVVREWLDEVVADNATVHLEQMSEATWYLGIYLASGTEIRVALSSVPVGGDGDNYDPVHATVQDVWTPEPGE